MPVSSQYIFSKTLSCSVEVVLIDVELLFFLDEFVLGAIHVVPAFLAKCSFVVDQHVLDVRNLELKLAPFDSFSNRLFQDSLIDGLNGSVPSFLNVNDIPNKRRHFIMFVKNFI